MILRELAAKWVGANCPSEQVQKDFLQKLETTLRHGVGCSFVIGRRLTKAGQPMLVYCFCGELFVFQLTATQAARLEVADNMLVCAGSADKQYHEPRPEPLLHIESIELDRAEELEGSSPMTGTMKYRTNKWWSLPLALQVVCQPVSPESCTLYYHYTDLPAGEHTVRFSLSPPGKVPTKDGRPFSGVLPLFFQVYLTTEPETDPFATAMSSAAIQPPTPDPFTPLMWSEREPPLGKPFVPSAPLPQLVRPAATKISTKPSAWGTPPIPSPPRERFRAISDIRAVLVEVV